MTYWHFFNKFNLETEKKEEVQNVKKFFVRYSAPNIPQSERNLKQLALLVQASTEFTECVQLSVNRCWPLCRQSTVLFGRTDQAKYILN